MKSFLNTAVLALLLGPCCAFAQPVGDAWEADVRRFDSEYWKAFNECQVQKMASMNTDDLEFYHDKGGIEKGVAIFAESVAKNICGRPDLKVRREAVAESLRFYPMRDGDKLYGAIVTGEHLFYRTRKGGAETLGGRAQFTHMLLLKDGQWKVSRVLSFDHGPAQKR